jgi:hypothetical protein
MNHKHRIIPGYEGGEYVEGNVVSLTLTQHVMWHYAEWTRKKNIQDLVAYKMLSGQIGKEEAIETLIKEGAKKAGKYPRTVETRNLIRKIRTGTRATSETRQKMRESAKKVGREAQAQFLKSIANSPHKPKAGRKTALSRWGYRGLYSEEREFRVSLSETFIAYYMEFGING